MDGSTLQGLTKGGGEPGFFGGKFGSEADGGSSFLGDQVGLVSREFKRGSSCSGGAASFEYS